MAQGDAQRAWFPEMLKELSSKWRPDMSWEECAELCKSMTRRRSAIRKKRGITGPRMKCRSCGGVHDMGPAPVSIRSLLFALKNSGLLTDDEFARLDTVWKKYRRKNDLDCNGVPNAKAAGTGKKGDPCS